MLLNLIEAWINEEPEERKGIFLFLDMEKTYMTHTRQERFQMLWPLGALKMLMLGMSMLLCGHE